MKVDVVMCAWNSNKPYFIKCLNSVRREIPAHHFILVDRFSNDGTVETVKKIFPNAIVKETYANLGVARNLGIKLVDTEFFVFVDDDIELCRGWFNEITKYIDYKTGAVHGQAVPTIRYIRKFHDWIYSRWIVRRKGFQEYVQEITSENPDDMRGCTHNTLLRTYVVKDWKPSSNICAYEDHLLLRHVVKKGYNWKIVMNLSVEHHGIYSLRSGLKKAKWNTAGARLIEFDSLSFWSLTKTSIKGVAKALLASIETREPLILLYIVIGQLGYIQGWIGWTKYLVMER